jgi:hypothetical protein
VRSPGAMVWMTEGRFIGSDFAGGMQWEICGTQVAAAAIAPV